MDESRGIPTFVHRNVGRIGQHLALPLYRLHKRRRCLSDSVHRRSQLYWTSFILPRNDPRPVLQLRIR